MSRGGRLLGSDHRDGLIDEILRQVIAGVGPGIDLLIVDDQLRGELVGGSAEEPVESIEPPL